MCGLWMTLARAASPSAVAHLAALASGLSGLVTAPLVSGPLCVCCPAALTGDLFLLRCIHGCEAASDCCHCCHLLELYGQQVVPRGDTPCGRASNLLRLLYRMTSFRADAKKRPESVSGRNSRGFASLILWSGATGVPADRRSPNTYHIHAWPPESNTITADQRQPLRTGSLFPESLQDSESSSDTSIKSSDSPSVRCERPKWFQAGGTGPISERRSSGAEEDTCSVRSRPPFSGEDRR